MRKRVRFSNYILLAVLSVCLTGIAFTKERHPKAPLQRRAGTPKRSGGQASQGRIQDQQQVSGTRKTSVRSAIVNFAELARRDALAPAAAASQELHFVPEPEAEEEEGRERPVPANATVSRQENRLAVAQPLGPSPAPSLSFQGVQATGWIPPDTQGAAGPNHLLVAVNGGLVAQTKTGTTLGAVRSLTSFFSSVTNNSSDVFDPRVQYDPYGNRWMLVAVGNRDSATSSVLVAVSQTNDPTGNWNLYRIDADSADQSWADFPVLGFTKDWIVVSVNMFANPGSSAQFYSRFFVLNKANFYAGAIGNYTQISAPNSISGSIAPTTTYDPTLATMYLLQNWNGNFSGSGYLRLYTITGTVGSEVLNNVSSGVFISTPNPWASSAPGGVDFAPQSGTTDKIQVNDSRMQNVVYRNGSLWCTHTVFLPASGVTRSTVQWWQINPASNSVQQFGRVDDPTGNFFYGFPSISVNRDNDVLIGYARFSSAQFAGGGYAYRAGTDPTNSLRDDTLLKAGTSTYFVSFQGKNRWGDYSGTTVDPANDTDLWTIQEYTASTNTWGTWWGRIGGVVASPTNNHFSDAQLLSGASGSVSGSNAGATKEAGEPNHAGEPGGASVWYRWQVPNSGNAVLTTSGSNFDTLLAVYTGSSVGALTTVASNDDNPAGGLQSSLTFNAIIGTVYYLAVDGYNGATGNIALNWSLGTQPASTLRIDTVAPAAGRVAGAQQLQLTGAFAGLSTIMMGGNSAAWSYSNGSNDTSVITVTTPQHAAGAVTIELVPSSGSSYSKLNAFAYLPTVFTDNTLVAGATAVKAQHIIELRQSVEALRSVAGLQPAAWTDSALSPFATQIKAIHILELRTYLEEAAHQLGYSPVQYTDPSMGIGSVIKRVHLEELRQRVRLIAN